MKTLLTCLLFLASTGWMGAGTQPSVVVQENSVFISNDQLMKLGLNNHDCTMPILPAEGGKYWIYLSEGGATDGRHSNVVRLRTDLKTYDPASLEHIAFSDIPAAHVNQYNGWKLWLSYLHEIGTNEYLGIGHLEDQDFGSKECFRMGVAYSNDGAKSFKFLGFMLSPHLPDAMVKRGGGADGKAEGGALKINIACGGLRVDDKYFYLYISDMSRKDRSDRRIAVARALREEVIREARLGRNAKWSKYYNGEWSEPGMGGNSSSLGSMVEYHTSVAYNTHLKKWITFSRSGSHVIMRRSADPLNFDVADEKVFPLPAGTTAAYFSIHPLEGPGPEVGREFLLFYRTDHRVNNKRIFDTMRLKIAVDS